MSLLRRLSALSAVAILIGCGDLFVDNKAKEEGGGGGGVDRENGLTFADDKSLPKCDDAREGFLVYVIQTKTFRTCVDGTWTVIDLRGPAGKDGKDGKDGVDGKDGAINVSRAIELYEKYRKSVFRLTMTCTYDLEACPAAPANAQIYRASAFLCGESVVCTNKHASVCPVENDDPSCLKTQKIELQAVVGAGSSVNPESDKGSGTSPWFSTTGTANVLLHPKASKDLAKIKVTNVPEGAKALPLSKVSASKSITPFKPILSMSFPLGFQDLYMDIGFVNQPNLTHCDDIGKYKNCPGNYYDFSTSNDTDHGSSGSPLIDLESGEVVGVTTAGTEGENANYTWAVDASDYKDVK